ncbi:BON domain-containing protein [Aestuariivirga sp.]|uniref:BON domain-containing protein n=1 Tax=Aestuariivirga sp. TaxID=2650926 RepID=UPI003BAD6957
MAQNRDRNWQEKGQQAGSGRGGWRGGEDQQGEQHFDEARHRGSWHEDRDPFGSGEQGGNWQGSGGSGPQQDGQWNRLGRYSEETSQGGQGRWGQGGNNRMDRDNSQFGSSRGSQDARRSYGGEQGYGGSRGSFGSPSGYGSDSAYGQQEQRGFLDRATDEVSSWFGDDQAKRRREMDEHRGRGPKGYTRSDDRIREDVNDRLTEDGWVDASEIEVQVSSSEVTLTGQVNSREEKRRAEDIVEAISGVRHVQNNIRVKDRNRTATTQFGSGSTADQAGNSVTSSTATPGSGTGRSGTSS